MLLKHIDIFVKAYLDLASVKVEKYLFSCFFTEHHFSIVFFSMPKSHLTFLCGETLIAKLPLAHFFLFLTQGYSVSILEFPLRSTTILHRPISLTLCFYPLNSSLHTAHRHILFLINK